MSIRETRIYPSQNEPFELILDGDIHTPLSMVGEGVRSKDWQHNGPVVKGQQTKRFKLVNIGFQPNMDAVRLVLEQYGSITEGQWLMAFMDTFNTPNSKDPIGVADSSWINPQGVAAFPCIQDLDLGFCWTNTGNCGVPSCWLWLVPADDSQ